MIRDPTTVPPRLPMPPMMMTMRVSVRILQSSPTTSMRKVPPTTPDTPARKPESVKTKEKRRLTLMPSADTISKLSTPARMVTPRRVFLRKTHKTPIMNRARPTVKMRYTG